MIISHFHKIVPALIAALAITGACSNGGRSDVEAEKIEFLRLDRAIAELSDSTPLDPALNDGAIAWLLMTRGIAPESLLPSTRDSLLLSDKESRGFIVFERDVERLLPSLSGINASLGKITGLPKRIFGMVSPYNQSVMTVDSVIVVALNHYLGADYEGYTAFPDYIRRNKTLDRIPVDVAESWIRGRFPFPDSIAYPTLLQRMAYEGAVLAEAADELEMPDGPMLLGWTQDEWNSAVANEKEAWRRIVGREMLFSDDAALIARLMSPAPSSQDISPDAPGRLGRFMGLRIIRALNLTPSEILSSKTYLDSSIAAAYAAKL